MSSGTQGAAGEPGKARKFFDNARHNERLLDYFESRVLEGDEEFLDWAIVVMFYSALHYVYGGLMRDHGVVPINHPQCHDLVKEHFPGIAEPYFQLYQLSRQARYFGYWTEAQSLKAKTQLQLFRRSYFDEIKSGIGPRP